jgi:hypothetical protein
MAAQKPKADAAEKKAKKAPATGFAPLKFKDVTITQKRSGRYEIVNAKGKNVNGEEKVKLLLEAKLLSPSLPKAASETPAT